MLLQDRCVDFRRYIQEHKDYINTTLLFIFCLHLFVVMFLFSIMLYYYTMNLCVPIDDKKISIGKENELDCFCTVISSSLKAVVRYYTLQDGRVAMFKYPDSNNCDMKLCKNDEIILNTTYYCLYYSETKLMIYNTLF